MGFGPFSRRSQVTAITGVTLPSNKDDDVSSLGLIANPHSGKNKHSPNRLNLLRQQLGERGRFCVPNSISDLPDIIRELRRKGLTVLCIDGGDGTVHQVVNALFQVYGNDLWPQIALLKGGTMNNIARNVGVPLLKRSKGLLSDILSDKSLRTNRHHPLIVDNKAGFIFGVGGVA